MKKAIIIMTPYTSQYTGKINNGEHRYSFNENTFLNLLDYKYLITDYVNDTKSKCIIYKIKGEYNGIKYKTI